MASSRMALCPMADVASLPLPKQVWDDEAA